MKQSYLLSASPHGFHNIAYMEWGIPNPRPIICVHGLTRNSRDFDFLAEALSQQGHYVICPDIVGRGDSDWLIDPKFYDFSQYRVDMTALIARLNCTEVDWIGTSMGGILGMGMAALPKTPIRRLILNDIGAYIPIKGIKFIQSYLGQNPTFQNYQAAENYFKKFQAGFGSLTEEQWQQVTIYSIHPLSDGQYQLKIDPAINLSIPKLTILYQALLHPLKLISGKLFDIDLWEFWQKVTCPTLVIHGENSEILPEWVCSKMQQIHPDTQVIDIPNTGHAPALMSPEQIQIIQQWLKK